MMNIVALAPGAVLAHSGPPPAPANLWISWTLDPLLIATILLGGWLYSRGLAKLWSHRAGSVVTAWRAECFAGGLAVIAVALISPVDALSSALFSVHMVQHLLLIAVASPLLVLGAPLTPMLVALPAQWRRGLRRRAHSPRLRGALNRFRAPILAWIIATGTLWLWHVPALYESALRSQPIHALEHALLLISACVFWFAVLPDTRRKAGIVESGLPVAVLSLAGMVAQGTALGIALAFSSSPWYASYASTTAVWHLTPLQDQQIAGLIMWIPVGAIYLGAALVLIGRAIADPSADPHVTRALPRDQARLPL